jgi:ribosomal protein S17
MTDQIRTLQGRVVSDKMDKSITVAIERKVKHPMYGKIIVRSTKFMFTTKTTSHYREVAKKQSTVYRWGI